MSNLSVEVRELAVNAEYPDITNLHPDDWDTCKVVSEEKKNFDS